VNMPQRPDQAIRQSIPLSPAGLTVAQLQQAGLLTDADMVALGLMKDTTGHTINSTLGVPAQTDDVVTTLPSNLQTMGVPPYIPNLSNASQSRMTTAGSPYTLVTVASASRIWFAGLSFGTAANSRYTGSNDPAARIYIGGLAGTILVCQAVLANAGQNTQSDQTLSMGGIAVGAGTTVYADVNGGTAITDVSMNASAVILYTTP
jgi:hypothetical protein